MPQHPAAVMQAVAAAAMQLLHLHHLFHHLTTTLAVRFQRTFDHNLYNFNTMCKGSELSRLG